MKISELISELVTVMKSHGDQEVHFYADDFERNEFLIGRVDMDSGILYLEEGD